jgi:hypothetical protein
MREKPKESVDVEAGDVTRRGVLHVPPLGLDIGNLRTGKGKDQEETSPDQLADEGNEVCLGIGSHPLDQRKTQNLDLLPRRQVAPVKRLRVNHASLRRPSLLLMSFI